MFDYSSLPLFRWKHACAIVNNTHQWKPLDYACRPYFPLRVEERWWRCGRHSFYFEGLEAKQRLSSTHSFPPNLNWQSCHLQRAHSPVSREAPPDVFGSHLSLLGMWWRQQLCSNLCWWYHTATRRVSAPPEVTPLPYYSFTPSAWWIMMLLAYLGCRGDHAHASVAHSVAFHLCAASLRTDLLFALVNWICQTEFPFNHLSSCSGYWRLQNHA